MVEIKQGPGNMKTNYDAHTSQADEWRRVSKAAEVIKAHLNIHTSLRWMSGGDKSKALKT